MNWMNLNHCLILLLLNLKGYFGIPGSLGDRMFDLITQKRHDDKLTFEDLVIAKGTCEKGTKEEIQEFIFQLLDVNDDDKVCRSDMKAVLAAIFDGVFAPKDGKSYIIDDILNAIQFSENSGKSDERRMSFEDFKNLSVHVPSIRKYLRGLLVPSETGSQVPRLLYSKSYDPNIQLREEYAWLIGGLLTQPELAEWKLLYHSSFHGQSFNTFLGNISNEEGPTLLIIKDKEGCIYGGYASQPWEKHSDFYGDMKCFLFQLHPKVYMY